MAPRKDASSGSDSDSDVPEAIPLSQSKKQIQKLESSRKNAVLAERQSRKTQNRERDRKLKERAEKNKKPVKDKGKGKEESEEDDDEEEEEAVDGLEARMLRAMKDAQDEEDEEDEEGFEGFGNVQLDEDEDESGSQDSEENDSEEEEEEGSDDDDDESQDSEESEGEEEPERPSKPKTSTKFNPDHLPDELFEAAFASQTGTKRTFTDDADITSSKRKTSPRATKKRKTNPKTPKDIIVGSKAIRVLPSSVLPPAPATLPSRKINNFLNRTLALKGGKQRARGWERRPTNIGVLRAGAEPALNFVRNK
ncbi:hypothetical protein GALMADRAFT_145059 [Galerina marginata CBS 339.88]|uniref:Uncharacterized protein n=1 Tax=Galerina marginata (strain CBS 339.88) TaxID=685588 RepID=A0A067SJ46_GALM3|nr:hypothetical protein GALMADRAFT_145059 [Galerina marginata CBS 339.88]